MLLSGWPVLRNKENQEKCDILDVLCTVNVNIL